MTLNINFNSLRNPAFIKGRTYLCHADKLFVLPSPPDLFSFYEFEFITFYEEKCISCWDFVVSVYLNLIDSSSLKIISRNFIQ
jgi:hypothetical protein